ncbi:MAG: hypothetical protein M3220_22665, partial [Chloroflexota bacterium]|nr:hypothetical protein [Chloroflexota bacterium]
MALIIRHFDNPYTANDAVETLLEAGIPEGKIGFLTKEGVQGHFQAPPGIDPNDMGTGEGTMLGTLAGMVAAVAAMATPFGPIVAAGPLFGTLLGAIAGGATGGIVAKLVDFGIDRDLARTLAATLEDDQAVLLSVEVPDRREAEVRDLLAQTEELHEDEVRYFRTYHEEHQDVAYEEFRDAYHFGYRAAAQWPRPFEEAERDLRAAYPGDYDRDRE